MNPLIKRAADMLLLVCVVVLSGAAMADVAGKLARVPLLWTAGGHLLTAGLVVGAAAWVVRLVDPRGGRGTVSAALLLVGAARWLRGAAGVPPDGPLLVAECIGVVLLWVAVRRRPREVVPSAAEPDHRGI